MCTAPGRLPPDEDDDLVEDDEDDLVRYSDDDEFDDEEGLGDEGLLVTTDDPPVNLGPCCCCGATGGVRTIVMMSRLAPVPGTGWACLTCGLPADGAVYVACDACAEARTPPREVVHGLAALGGRAPVESLDAGVFDHEMSRHPEAVDFEEADLEKGCGE